MVNHTTLSSQLAIILCVTPHESAARAAGKVGFVNYTPFPTAPRILSSRHYIFVYFTLDS